MKKGKVEFTLIYESISQKICMPTFGYLREKEDVQSLRRALEINYNYSYKAKKNGQEMIKRFTVQTYMSYLMILLRWLFLIVNLSL